MEFPEKDELIARYQKYTDEELLAILKNPNDYQWVAVEAARKVASERGLEWAELPIDHPAGGFSIFPRLSNPENALKLIKSLQRLLYFVALIPLITAALSFTDGYPALAFVYGGIAVLWGVLAMLAVRRKRHQMVLLLFLLFIFMLVLRYVTAGLPVGFKLVDWVVAVIALGVLIYILLYFKILVRDYFTKDRRIEG